MLVIMSLFALDLTHTSTFTRELSCLFQRNDLIADVWTIVLNVEQIVWCKAEVGNDFFPEGVHGGGFGLQAQGGIRRVDFWTKKLTNFDQN